MAPPEVCEAALARTRIHASTRGPAPRLARVVAYFALRFRASGIAVGTDVFVSRSELDRGPPLALVIHEVTHVAQTLRDGRGPFLLRYVREYLAGRARGLDDHRAYLAISYEEEARRVAGDVEGGPFTRFR